MVVVYLYLRPEPPFTGVSGPSGSKSKKVSKRVFWRDLQMSPPKRPEKVKKKPIFRPFYFCYLGTHLQTPTKTLFETLSFCDFGPGGPRDSCKWRLGLQVYTLFPLPLSKYDLRTVAKERRWGQNRVNLSF